LFNISSHLNQKIHGRLFPYSFHRDKDIHIPPHLFLTVFYEDSRKLLKMLLQLYQ
jgi:hypothetical protein